MINSSTPLLKCSFSHSISTEWFKICSFRLDINNWHLSNRQKKCESKKRERERATEKRKFAIFSLLTNDKITEIFRWTQNQLKNITLKSQRKVCWRTEKKKLLVDFFSRFNQNHFCFTLLKRLFAPVYFGVFVFSFYPLMDVSKFHFMR